VNKEKIVANRQPWRCTGTIQKTDMPCRQTLGFYDADKMPLADLKGIVQLRCIRCKSLEGNGDLTLPDAA